MAMREKKSPGPGGFTLIEVVIALFIIVVSVSFSLNIMSRLTSYAGHRGHAMDVAAAVAISQNVLDHVRERPLPPGERSALGRLENYDGSDEDTADWFGGDYAGFHGDYRFTLSLERADAPLDGAPTTLDPADFDHSAGYDNLDLDPYRNLLRVEVNIFKGGIHLMRTVTYKTRNSYF